MKKEYSKRKFTIAVILSAILLLLISATTVHADANPLAKMPRKDSTVINKGIWWTGATFITPDLSSDIKISVTSSNPKVATVYKGNIIKNLIMDCQSYTKYRPNETTGGIFVSWRRKEELPTGA